MRTWTAPHVPELPGRGTLPTLHDTPTGQRRQLEAPGGVVSLYVCGITPYDATHLGHAATYLAYDLLVRTARDAGARVHYIQNVTDIDDPLLERATATGVDWRELAQQQIDLYRSDMETLRILPPTHYVGVIETMDEIADAVARLKTDGLAYEVPVPGSSSNDVYFDNAAAERATAWRLGSESGLDRDTQLQYFAERGGDPERPGKRDPLDPLLWRAERPGEPAWDSPLGRGRPGWHIECSVIGMTHARPPFSVSGGGADLLFPHHEFSAAHATALTGTHWAEVRTHAGLLALDGEKMSKSLGNLEFVHRLARDGVDPRAIRLALLAEHYRADSEWTPERLTQAQERLDRWVEGFRDACCASSPSRASGRRSTSKDDDSASSPTGSGGELLAQLRAALVDDLDAPRAIRAVDEHIAAGRPTTELDLDAIDALLGIDLRAPIR